MPKCTKENFVDAPPADHFEIHTMYKVAVAALHQVALHHRPHPLAGLDFFVSHVV